MKQEKMLRQMIERAVPRKKVSLKKKFYNLAYNFFLYLSSLMWRLEKMLDAVALYFWSKGFFADESKRVVINPVRMKQLAGIEPYTPHNAPFAPEVVRPEIEPATPENYGFVD